MPPPDTDPFVRASAALADARHALSSAPGDVREPLTDALERLASALEDLRGLEGRLTKQQALLDERLLRLENSRLFSWWKRIAVAGGAWSRRFSGDADSARDARDYAVWIGHEQASLPSREEAIRAVARWACQPVISVVGADTQDQVYPHCERCAAAADASGDYVMFPAVGDGLSPFAAYFFAEAAQRTGADVMYCDEDEMDAAGVRQRPVFKPDWSPELLKSAMYFGRTMVVRREAWLKSGGAASFHEFALRAANDREARVVHVARVLYHRRAGAEPAPVSSRPVVPGSIGRTVTVIVCSRNARLLERCLDRVRATAAGVVARVIVVCHEETGRNDELRSVAAQDGGLAVPYQGPFNFSAMNNAAAAAADTEHLLFLNDDVMATAPGWAEMLIDSLAEPHVGVAGAVLWYPSGTIQHAGIVCGIEEGAGHIGRGSTGSALWPWLLMKRDVSAVTGACLAMRRDLFASLGGFDEGFANNYNDVDLCLRVRRRGLQVICAPAPGLVHEECQSRAPGVRFAERYRFHVRWEQALSCPDPYYSTALAPYERIALNIDRV